ncbi:MAG: hypothetical protein ACI9I0_001626 [Rhodoferax sp.]|jgi:hypothetical protein
MKNTHRASKTLKQFKISLGFAICGGGLLVILSQLALWYPV